MRILLTSAGRRGYLVQYFKEALEGSGEIHVANSSPHSTAMKYGDKSVVTPLIYTDAYIPFLKEYCEVNQIDTLISLFDIDLPILAKSSHEFEQIGVKVIVSNEEVISICNDKWRTFNFLKEQGFHTPLTFLSIEEAILAVNEGVIDFPLIIKPRWGMGSIAVFEADNFEELTVLYQKIRNKVNSTYLSYESQQSEMHCVIIQEKLVGQEYGLDIINDFKGRYRSTIIKRKVAMRSGETDRAETIDNLILEQTGAKLSEALGHVANLDTDVFIVDGQPYILEMNARFGGGYPFSHIAGVNLPKAMIKWLRGEIVDDSLLKARAGVVGYKEIAVMEEMLEDTLLHS